MGHAYGQRLAGVAAVIAISVLAVGCSSSDSAKAPVPGRSVAISTTTYGTIGASESTVASATRVVALSNGASLSYDSHALSDGATITDSVIDKPVPDGGIEAGGGPVGIEVENGSIRTTVHLELPYDPTLIPAGTDPADVIAVVTAATAQDPWAEAPFQIDAARHVVMVDTPHLSIWDTIVYGISGAAGWFQQGLGQVLGTRAGPPPCGTDPKRGPLPSWVADTVTSSLSNDIVRSCAEGEGDLAVIEMVNNRKYPMILTFGAPVAWSWHDTPSDLGDQAVSAYVDAHLPVNSLLLPPLSRATIGVPEGSWSYASFTAQPTRLAVAALILSTTIDKVASTIAAKVAPALGSECLGEYVVVNTDVVPTTPSDVSDLAANVFKCIAEAVKNGALASASGVSIGTLTTAFRSVTALALAKAGVDLGAAATPYIDLLVGDGPAYPVPIGIRHTSRPIVPTATTPSLSALKSAAIPSICGLAPGQLVNGILEEPPNADGTPGGSVSTSGQGAIGDLDGDGHSELGAVFSCNGGGIGWPDHLVVFRDDLTMIGDLDTYKIFADFPVWRSVISDVAYSDGGFTIAVGLERSDVDVSAPGRVADRSFRVVMTDGKLVATPDQPGVSATSATPGATVQPASCIALSSMYIGMTGHRPEVALLQTTLTRLGYDTKGVDGYFGENTFTAAISESNADANDAFEYGVDEQTVISDMFVRLGINC